MSYFGNHSFGSYSGPSFGYLGDAEFVKPAGKVLTPPVQAPAPAAGGKGKINPEAIATAITSVFDSVFKRQPPVEVPATTVTFSTEPATDWKTYALYGVGAAAVLIVGYKVVLPMVQGR